jgi:hypothetical protein
MGTNNKSSTLSPGRPLVASQEIQAITPEQLFVTCNYLLAALRNAQFTHVLSVMLFF